MAGNKVALYVQLDDHLKMRLLHQCERLGISQAAIVKQALTKYCEEEEQIEENNARRRK
jgi:predicted transcriptional regulator